MSYARKQQQETSIQRPIHGPVCTEIAIVGGGPAGAVSALILARQGVRVKLIHWDGYAPEGVELISSHARQMIEHHCPDFFLRNAGLEIRKTIPLWATRERAAFNTMLDPCNPGIALERPILDRSLRDLAIRAGASVLPDAKVMSIEREEGNWKLLLRRGEDHTNSICARFLVIATGRAATDLVVRSSQAEPELIALMALLPASPARQPDDPEHTLYLEGRENGWWYALPTLRRSFYTGFCARREELKKRQISLREFFIQELNRTRLLAPLFKGVPAGFQISGRIAGRREFSEAAGDGWIAVGDAAFAPDPLSGMGLDWAIESAHLGSEAVVRAARGKGSDKFEEYNKVICMRASPMSRRGGVITAALERNIEKE